MLKDKESDQAEKLSQCLDALNYGSHPVVQDEEIQELIEFASVVKQSYIQEELPRVLIDSVVDQLATEFQENKKKRRTRWLYSGLAGTAAAVFFAAFVQFVLPQTVDQQIAQQIDKPMETQKIVAVGEQSNPPMTIEITPKSIPEEEPMKEKVPVTTVPIEEKVPPSVSEVLEEIVTVAKTPKVEEKPVQVAALQLEKPTERIMNKSILMAEMPISPVQIDKNTQVNSRIMMVIPNQTAQSITIDKVSGDIKQVYHLGHDDEIVMIQGLAPVITEKTKDGVNRFIVKVDKYTIQIEGKKTSEELKKIAESLIEKEIKQ